MRLTAVVVKFGTLEQTRGIARVLFLCESVYFSDNRAIRDPSDIAHRCHSYSMQQATIDPPCEGLFLCVICYVITLCGIMILGYGSCDRNVRRWIDIQSLIGLVRQLSKITPN